MLAPTETRVTLPSESCLLIAAWSSVVPFFVKTVALNPESLTFSTPACAVKTELVFFPMPHPLPDTVTI